ncbi:MAG: hypothetical protein CML20_04190 [Rheinheimera sp.]|nr:hypothetical protein [Rheinheimera sp.]|tara:strand:- start:42616 stop:42879 length:264 start_codon:yes stop_codon:yes gene_type:complete
MAYNGLRKKYIRIRCFGVLCDLDVTLETDADVLFGGPCFSWMKNRSLQGSIYDVSDEKCTQRLAGCQVTAKLELSNNKAFSFVSKRK